MSENDGARGDRWGPIAVVAAAVIGAVALIIVNWPSISQFFFDGAKKQVSGSVYNAKTKAPLDAVVVQLNTADDKPRKQATTDGAGHFSLEIPADLAEIRLVATKTGYFRYERVLPAAQSLMNDIPLERMPIMIGVPDNSQLGGNLTVFASKLNVAIVFSPSSSQRAKLATVAAAELQADPDSPEEVIQALLDRVKDNKLRCRVTTIEARRRYEITCH